MSELSETITNVVENVACHVAQDRRGRISPASLVPYLPMSLSLIEAVLNDMVNDTSVFSERRDGFKEYLFTAYEERPGRDGPPVFDACVSCGKDLSEDDDYVVCSRCMEKVREELGTLAERNAWPAQAVYEHEILHLAANTVGKQGAGTVHAEDLAGRSRYTLRSMRRKLKRMVREGFARQDLDMDGGLITYSFPEIEYPKGRYRKNMAVIRSYPASVMEEVELKTVRIIITLALMVVAMLVLAFMRVPFHFLVAAFVVAAPTVSLLIWRRRSRPEGD